MDALIPLPAASLPLTGHILGIGTNLDPERNAARIAARLADLFGRVLLSRFYRTAPVGMASAHPFVNYVAYVPSALDPACCKGLCVGIELALGRDRDHPGCKTRDRPADIDLIGRVGRSFPADGLAALRPDPYLAAPFAEIAALLTGKPVPPPQGDLCATPLPGCSVGSPRLGETPATVHRDDGAGLIVVLENGLDRQADGLHPALLAEQRL
ncbi:2-amino-4-hydroxy-6-hydroxymethyldihydropteridine diphosphokinase [Azospirillum brasilense]|uniref:2-amino-4-hydroxy-6-hydroxymethyldihydropteridine diphosphokinase n=1 Tax=Azospirillum brasilense TaxID=192 RepID=A0A560BG08_AZOBR|nr:2-amino-4-hydroxy-6-hydroxymethyldihydropteridine diphosphokinase [Azospirillum brasilense]